MFDLNKFIDLSSSLDSLGLVWRPEIGDEICLRSEASPDVSNRVSILVDPQGQTPRELRNQFIWLPTVEQFVHQFEARQAMIHHVGMDEKLSWVAVIKTSSGLIESEARSMRILLGKAMKRLLSGGGEALH